MEPRADGALRDLQRLGDLLVGQADEVLQDHDGPLIERQSLEATIQLVAIGDGAGMISRIRSLWQDAADPPVPEPSVPRLGVRRPHHDAVGPCLESVRVLELGKMAPDVDERLLGGVLRPSGIAEDVVSGGVHRVTDPDGERGEG